MLKRSAFILLTFISSAAWAQADLKSLLETTNGSISAEDARTQINSIIEPLAIFHIHNKALLHKTFKKISARFLRKYEAYSDFDQLFRTGKFDCLTATALFSLALDQLQYPYEVIETNYHIFLLVQTTEGEVLIETTDRFGGFVTDPRAIRERTMNYWANEPAASGNARHVQYSFKLYQSISPANLNGLLLFNQAVKAYNQDRMLECAILLERANLNYSSPRCDELGIVLIRSVMQSSMTSESKDACMSHLTHVLAKKPVAGLD